MSGTRNILTALESRGLNIHAWIRASEVNDPHQLLPANSRSLLLIGNGGRGLWGALESATLASPDPIENHVRTVLEPMRPAMQETWGDVHFLYPFGPLPQLDFVALARVAGWGLPGPFGMAIHPTYGPWWAMRAAIAVVVEVEEYAGPSKQSVCEGCPAPCLTACPPGATRFPQLDFERCTNWRINSGDCQDLCHARLACPVGLEHRYSPSQAAYHARASLASIHQYMKKSSASAELPDIREYL